MGKEKKVLQEEMVNLQKRLDILAEQKAMEPVRKAVQSALAQKRRLYDEIERRKLLKLA